MCVPTYDRAARLERALESIRVARERAGGEVQVCVSDNASTDGTPAVIARAAKAMPLTARRNERNLGGAMNFLKAVELAEGDFVWLVGDDDLLHPDALSTVLRLIAANPAVDYFFVNAARAEPPFDPASFPEDLPRFSPRAEEGPLPFFDLVDPAVSFDFLLGIFLSVFRRRSWVENLDAVDPAGVADPRPLTTPDNTFPHLKVFAKAFAGSTAYFHPRPLTACVSGAREWSPMYPFVRSVRLPQALDEYRRRGLPYGRWWRAKNAALKDFLPDLANMLVHRGRSGWEHAPVARLLAENAPFPNAWLSPLYYAARKLGAAGTK